MLDPAAARGVLALALHPVMTFTGRPEDARPARAARPSASPRSDELRPVAESLVVEMGGEPVWVPESARPLYHAALTIGANHLVTLVNDALVAAGRRRRRRAGPAARAAAVAALDNVLRLGDAALTGPVSRGDVATVARAPERAVDEAPRTCCASYVAMARRTAERATRVRAV